MRARHSRESGFSLLELIAAVTIFVLIAAVSMQITNSAMDNATRARNARELRYLAEYRAEQIKTFAEHYDEFFDDADFDDLGEQYEGFKWSLDIRDVVVFGESTSEEIPHYFDDPDAADDEDETPAAGTTPGATPVSPEELRELILTVKAPAVDGGSDSIQLVLLLPRVQ